MGSWETGWRYAEFISHVRRFDQDTLLELVAATALALPRRVRDNPSRYVATPPWALAAVVKASLCHGNPHRSQQMRPQDLRLACYMFNNMYPEELADPGLQSVLAFWVRTGYEQLPYQEEGYEELARAEAFFNGYSGNRPLTVITAARIAELLGAPLRDAAGVARMIYTGADANAGFFDLDGLTRQSLDYVLDILPREVIQDVIDTSFATDVSGFRQLAEEAPVVPFLAKYMFNPLVARPLIRRRDGRLIAPVPQLVSRRMSPLELYYAGLRRWGGGFAIDMGYLFEDYVGRQLATLPAARIEPAVEYHRGKDRVDTTDWFVVLDDVVLVVEAKAARLKAGARAGDDSLTEMVKRTVGKAIKQINRSYGLMQAGAAEVSHLPKDRPVLALVATLDPWYITDSAPARELLPECDVPFAVCSVRELEMLVSVGQRKPLGPVLREIIGNPEHAFGAALKPHCLPADRNPALDDAWKKYPFN